MADTKNHQLSDILDRLEETTRGDTVSIGEVLDHLGDKSFYSAMLVFALICASPASAIPGLTAFTAAIIFALVVQIILCREHIWLPSVLLDRPLSTQKLAKGIAWLRKPIDFIERFLNPRLEFLLNRPWELVPLLLILALTTVMPFLEVIPTSGSIASAIIALFAIGRLTHDGAFVLLATVLLLAVPLGLYQAGVI